MVVHVLLRILLVSYGITKVTSIIETFRGLVSPSLGGISSVPMVILPMLRSFMNLCLVISTASTAVDIACPLAFKVISLVLEPLKPVIIAKA
jgi:hypothetical protein